MLVKDQYKSENTFKRGDLRRVKMINQLQEKISGIKIKT
jgi:hypothetical protein